mmetsp:Transcript_16065/g.44221  ORF Transcript_16065/g.44221 Transcript_16065/m.44221 type:complete len:247 (-) Transcript_16065:79-819(-)
MIFTEFLVVPGRVATMIVATLLVHGCLFRSATRLLHTLGQGPSFLRSPSRTKGGRQIEPVTVQVSLEALCIDSKNYVQNDLASTFNTLGPSVMDLSVIAYGNAKLDNSTQQIICQHGDAECDANSYQQCAISVYPSHRYMPFLECLFATLPMGKRPDLFPASTFAGCARRSALDWNTIRSCHDDPSENWRLQVEAAKNTPSDHDHVPWVVLDGVHVSENTSLLQAVCDAYSQRGGKDPACAPSKSQ